MTKLKLGTLVDDKPVKLSIELPAGVHRDLVAYAQILARSQRGDDATRPGKACSADGRAIYGYRS